MTLMSLTMGGRVRRDNFGHLHGESEDAAAIDPVREDVKLASVLLNDLLGDHEAETDALVVHLGRPEQLAELAAELGNLVFVDTAATIADLDFQ